MHENEIVDITEDPFNPGSFSAISNRNPESYTVRNDFTSHPGFVGFQLQDRPDQSSLKLIIYESGDTFDTDTDEVELEIITSGVPNYVQALLEPTTGWVYLHADRVGQEVVAWYDSYGSNFNVENISSIVDDAVDAYDFTDAVAEDLADDADFTNAMAGNLADDADFKFQIMPVGTLYSPYPAAGVDVPDASSSKYTFIKLEAGLTGAGQYNEGKLTSETTSGSAPLNTATAVVSVANSPLNGQTINLIETERRFLRAGSAGTLQDDQFQMWQLGATADGTGSRDTWAVGEDRDFYQTAAASSGDTTLRLRTDDQGYARMLKAMNDGTNGDPRTGLETRARNIGVAVYLKVK